MEMGVEMVKNETYEGMGVDHVGFDKCGVIMEDLGMGE